MNPINQIDEIKKDIKSLKRHIALKLNSGYPVVQEVDELQELEHQLFLAELNSYRVAK